MSNTSQQLAATQSMFVALGLIAGVCLVAAGGGVELWGGLSLDIIGWGLLISCGVLLIGVCCPRVSVDRVVDSMVLLSPVARLVLSVGALACGALVLMPLSTEDLGGLGLLGDGVTLLGVASIVLGFWVVIPMMFPLPFPAWPGTETSGASAAGSGGSGRSSTAGGSGGLTPAGGVAAGGGTSASGAGGAVAAGSPGVMGGVGALIVAGLAIAGTGAIVQLASDPPEHQAPSETASRERDNLTAGSSAKPKKKQRASLDTDHNWGFGGDGGATTAPAPGTIVLFAGPAAMAMRRRRSSG